MHERESVDMKRPTKLAIWLSAVCPGVGQFVQGRWIHGILYLVVFLACIVVLLIEVFGALVANFHTALDFADGKANQPFVTISIKKVLTLFCFAITAYVLALFDVIIAHSRKYRKWLELKRGGYLSETDNSSEQNNENH